ncbi:hypothetical protein P7E02_12590 [Enterococcus hulanensis]|uniref:hypothetical protein n=1 Tax=Enterococcus hulanensis TaxID=2559929 RepID=UPI002890A931|nr:hypothetical protein [Enterococcus hulanensis]MDT2660712.1 hypothetical protein [Enterococcus hulanensis]
MKRIVKYSAIILFSSLLGGLALSTDFNIDSQQTNVVYAAKKKANLNSNKSIEKYLKKQNKSLKVLEVNGTYTEKGNYTMHITLDAKDNGMNNAKNQVIMAVKALNKKSVKNFSNIGISVKADMTDGDKGYAIKSDWNPEFINSNDAKTIRLKNVEQRAKSWWQLEN